MNCKSFEYDCRWSSEADDDFITNFLEARSEIEEMNSIVEEKFKKKYLYNIYGDSVLAIVYDGKKPIATRGLWRNDIQEKRAYQPVDTFVKEDYRKQGLFREMTTRSLSLIDEDDVIYNFPNINSYPGYIKMGWNLLGEYRPVLFTSMKNYRYIHKIMIDDAYVEWWLTGREGYFSLRYFNSFLLVAKKYRLRRYLIIGEITESAYGKFPTRNIFTGLYFYQSTKVKWYSRELFPLRVVAKCKSSLEIPIWKMDCM